ncbi:MAG: ferredoxin [Zetaproteobacteria bacterium CG06_land_8_20_14_3_00_59_53]|nr:MAG: ferredoxin [Zetaproteobacteria bacterium CG2_30_59_37]PIO89687.1 MAG: ferredoxin [Zetaproteobacteria bacterium CG23_combo_of_CG06-09_8_20_14_all_59_86]PIQ65756.1 MAG: ferredoxin [Zetaproteobacteria bacterium CG11_big_fil_rev_8_21_14_0_20_59_439]PIU70097.1 MAG: ferredoxin [Zetaproteobacteria bacterium CG06_land_8_20_14_3_00_59_53]PIU96578.1 MAG: ferredoxin [Zetaproteobacteria bacterium CG03_land_8_20_14_0_80_59_51]PIY46092.1 MAG: ferredoxin [Zetaproteobacteria bacterium CG_4_10_14_0_8_u
MSEWIDVAPEEALTPGDRCVVETEIGPIAVFNLDGELYALADVCTHDGGELASGKCVGDQIICPRHGARFCIRDGRALTPPAFENIETFPLRVEAGVIQLDIDT